MIWWERGIPLSLSSSLNLHIWTPRNSYSKLQSFSTRPCLEIHSNLSENYLDVQIFFSHSKQKKRGILLVWIREIHNKQGFSQHKQQREDNAQPPHTRQYEKIKSFTKRFRLIDFMIDQILQQPLSENSLTSPFVVSEANGGTKNWLQCYTS